MYYKKKLGFMISTILSNGNWIKEQLKIRRSNYFLDKKLSNN